MPTVLIVEDEAVIRVLTESVLQKAGYETPSAGTLAEAQALILRIRNSILFSRTST
jgi:CheY-like chemotaxis protein